MKYKHILLISLDGFVLVHNFIGLLEPMTDTHVLYFERYNRSLLLS
jgi:hypothetical protein